MSDDNDALTYQEAVSAVTALDLAYRLADFTEKLELKDKRDEAYNALSAARLRLLEEGVITTAAHVEEMKSLREEIENAADVQTLIVAAGRLAGFLARVVA